MLTIQTMLKLNLGTSLSVSLVAISTRLASPHVRRLSPPASPRGKLHSNCFVASLKDVIRFSVVSPSKGPKVPVAEFERLKQASPSKKQKIHDTVLHTVDVKSVRFVYVNFNVCRLSC
jgi:hypothetical protein